MKAIQAFDGVLFQKQGDAMEKLAK